ncbi:MAG: DEAD/DEAH box helicase [Polyangiales bacterium]
MASTTPDAPTLRPYQRDAVSAVIAARRAGVRRMVVCLPTGAGKTVVFAQLAGLARRAVVVLAHREELLSQAQQKLQRALGDDAAVSVEQGPRRADPGARVVVCSVRSLRSDRIARLRQARDIGLVIYDECHHAAAEDNLRVLRELGCFEPDWTGTLVGFTATTARGDGKGLDQVFERIVYARTLPEMILDGYLAPLRGFRVQTRADLTRVSAAGQDFDEVELAEAVDIEERNALVARSIQELARDRRTIAFCVNVGHAQNLRRALGALGVRAATVHGEMPAAARAKVLRDFAAGRVQVVTNVAVLTEGFDDPGVSCVAMARPTRSAGTYAQCVGRGTRLAEGKRDCLVLDFADVSELSLCSLPSLFGMPREMDLEGEDVREALQVFERIAFDHPAFEAEAGAITLGEIQRRAAAFDPLTAEVHEDVRAISANAWSSLGRYGLALHFEGAPGRVHEALVRPVATRGKRWEVRLDGREVARFSTVDEAVDAVDFEVQRRGPHAARSARAEAPWRRGPCPAARAEAVRGIRPGHAAPRNLAELLALEAWALALRPTRPRA